MEVMVPPSERFLQIKEIIFVRVVIVTFQQRTVRFNKAKYSCH